MASVGLLGSTIDRYSVEALLGVGGFGAVYRAKHQHTDAHVALKVLKRHVSLDPQMVDRFLREAKAAATIGSEQIVRVLDAGIAQPHGQAFLAMELLVGSDLKELAARQAPLPSMRVVLLLTQVLEGLAAAHNKGIVHRDMKPANVFVQSRPDERGTERDVGGGLTMTGTAMGTPAYMAPERFFDARNVDARADVYSVAVMAYELLCGKLPIDAESYAELIVRVKTEAPAALGVVAPNLPGPLSQAVMVGLAKDRAHRWASASAFANALRSAVGIPVRVAMAPSGLNPAVDSASVMLGQTFTPQPKLATPGPVVSLPATPTDCRDGGAATNGPLISVTQ